MADTETRSEIARPTVAILLSGSGRTLQNLLDCVKSGELGIQIVRVISTRKRVRGIDVARDAGVPLTVIPRREHNTVESFSEALFGVLNEDRPDLIVCGGFLSRIVVPDNWIGRIINIHPSLLPLFGGKGFYGAHVHQSVLDSGMRVSGCTVHFVNNEYDAGPIIAQRCVPVEQDDTVDSLAARVFAMECELYPAVIRDLLEGRIHLAEGRVYYSVEQQH